MAENRYDKFRQEIKFLIPAYAEAELKNILAIEGWNTIFPKRRVYSVYFDTVQDEFLFDSIYGISERVKYRARWYNCEKYFVIECKIKHASASNKAISKPVEFNTEFPDSKKLDRSLWEFYGQELFQRSFVSYNREYYFHPASQSRLTLDFDLLSFDFDQRVEREIKSFLILEVKAQLGSSFSVAFSQFRSRFSKYCFSRLGNDSFY